MNEPVIQPFFALVGINSTEGATYLLAVCFDQAELFKMVPKIQHDYPGTFDAFSIAEHGGFLLTLQENKAGAARPTHKAPPTKS